MFTMLLSVALFLWPVKPEPQTVCGVLGHLSDLNGKEVRVRGAWFISRVTRTAILTPLHRCENPTIRDGWQFGDVVQTSVMDKSVDVGRIDAEYGRLSKSSAGAARIVATLTGRLETQEHFGTDQDVSGAEHPRAYAWFAPARLMFRDVENLQLAPYAPGEEKDPTREIQRLGNLVPRRVER
jgi:hypothetical protein